VSFVVDTCVLIDILIADKAWAKASARTLTKYLDAGLVISPLSLIELAPAFSGDRFRQAEFLEGVGVDFSESWEREDTEMAATVWTHYARTRKSKTITKRPMADILIGAFSMRFSGLLTRNEDAGYSGTDRACELAHAGVNAQRARVRA